MKNTLFKTKNGNSYIYSFYHNHTIVAHPILEHILKNQFETDFIDNLLSFDHITIGKKRYSSKEIRHYCSKYIFLKKHHFFSEINIKNILSGNIKAEAIAEQLNSVNDIVFEITEKCNLKCNYCVYGEHYSIHSDRKHFDMEVGNAKRLLDFFTPKWLSDNNNFYENITIGFYGGEPLLKFNTIKEIVEYTQEITKKTGLMFNFNMTSNGLLLSEYIDFLIKHDFTLTVSLDGNDTHNRHRITSAGTPSFDIVYKNIKSVQAKHPVYYKNKMYWHKRLGRCI